jgi:type II secretory pathway pseudopilin PulG
VRRRLPLRRGEQGAVLIALLVMIALLGIMLGAAMTELGFVAQREKELELRFRGNQIVRAIGEYQNRNAGTSPSNFKQLLQSRPPAMRRCWVDPMTAEYDQLGELVEGTGKWIVIGQGEVDTPSTKESEDDALSSRRAEAEPVLTGCDDTLPKAFDGVRSPSHGEAITAYRRWEPGDEYTEWRFRTLGQASQPGTTPGGPDDPHPPGFAGMRLPGGPPIRPGIGPTGGKPPDQMGTSTSRTGGVGGSTSGGARPGPRPGTLPPSVRPSNRP